MFEENEIEIQQVFSAEAEALQHTGKVVAPQIAKVSQLMYDEPGRVVVTGIGKSGHVARKISATLASIGKPAYFVHATEASHGDMGNLVDGDIVLALSNSGETSELSDVIHYCRSRKLPFVALTSDAQSALARFATHKIIYPPVKEVCAIGRAPTTSTTVMMVIGDALIVSLSRLLGTTDDDFKRFHPGGSLGSRLKTVAEIARSGEELPIVSAATSMHDAMVIMSEKGLGVTFVRDINEEIAGIITDGDLRRMGPDVWNKLAGEAANYNMQYISADTLVTTALEEMQARKVTSLAIAGSETELISLVHIHDCLRLGAL